MTKSILSDDECVVIFIYRYVFRTVRDERWKHSSLVRTSRRFVDFIIIIIIWRQMKSEDDENK